MTRDAGELPSLLRSASVYGASNVLMQAVPVLLIPVLTRHLTPADYGTQAVFLVLAAALLPLVGLNVHSAIARRYFDRDEIDLPGYVFTALVLVVGASLMVAALLSLGGEHVAALSGVPANWLWAALVVATSQVVTLTLLGLLQAQGRAAHYGFMQVGRTTTIALGTCGLVIGLGLDWRGPVLAQAATAAGFMLLSLGLLQRGAWVAPRFNGEHVRHALVYGLPLVPHVLSGVLMHNVDRLFVLHHAGIEQTGLYTLGSQVGAVIGLLEDSFNRAYQPWLYAQLKRDDAEARRHIVRFTYGYFAVLASIAVLLGAMAPWILSLVVPVHFQDAHVFVVWIALGYAFGGMYKMMSGYLFFAGRTGRLASITVTAAVTNLGLNFVLVPRHGAMGAAYAACLSFLLSFALTFVQACRLVPGLIPFGSRR